MAVQFILLTENDRKDQCKAVGNDVLKAAEHLYNNNYLLELSTNFSHYFEILHGALTSVFGNKDTYVGWEYGGSTKATSGLNWNDPKLYFEYGLYLTMNAGIHDLTTFLSMGLTSQAVNRIGVDKGLADTDPYAAVTAALKKIRGYIHTGWENLATHRGSVTLADISVGVPKKVDEGLIGLIDKKLQHIKGQVAGKIDPEKQKNALQAFIKELGKNSPGQGLYQMVLFYDGTAYSGWTTYANTLLGNAPSSTQNKVFGFDGTALKGPVEDFFKKKDSMFAIASGLRTKKNWLETLKEELADKCEALPTSKGAKGYAKNKDRGRAQVANLQCVLPMLETFYAANDHHKLKDYYPFARDVVFDLNSHGVPEGRTASFYKADNFPFLIANSNDAIFFINKLFRTKTNTQDLRAFTELTNADVSQLVPKIEIFKIRYKPLGSDNEVAIPIDFSQKIELTETQLYERENAGVERVRFRMLGRNPAEVDKYISCEVSLFFDSINAFLKERTARVNGIDYDYSYKDFLMRHTKLKVTNEADLKKKLKASFKNFKLSAKLEDNITDFETRLRRETKAGALAFDVANEKHFRVRIDLGWQPYAGLKPNIKRFLENSNISLYLTLQTHSFSFSNDGTIALKLNYMGSVEGQMIENLQTNIFFSKDLSGATKSQTALNQIISLINAMKSADSELLKIAAELTKLRKNIVAYLDAQAKDKQKQLWNSLRNNDGLMKQKVIKKNKAGKVSTSWKKTPTHILKGTIPQEFAGFGQTGVSKLLTSAQKNIITGRRSNLVVSSDIVMSHLMEHILAKKTKVSKRLLSEIKHEMVELSGADFAKTGRRPPKSPSQQAKLSKKGKFTNLFNHSVKKLKAATPVEFYFTRFGSLLYSALETLWHENPVALKDTVFVLGPIKFASSYTGKDKYTNFAQLPILLDSWNSFFSKKVLSESLQGEATRNAINYPLMRFFHDIIGSLLMNGVFAPCDDLTNSLNPLRFVKPKVAIFSAVRNENFKPVRAIKGEKQAHWRRLNVSVDHKGPWGDAKMQGMNKDQPIFSKNITTKRRPSDVKNFIVLYDAGFTDTDLNRLYNVHMNSNIMHFFIGANRGILKNIRFDKSDIRGFQEAKVLDEGNIEGGLLREKYNANIDVVGTSYFMQGMKFYLDPTFVGMDASAANVLQRDIGLGGYYVITDVHSDITPSDFETSMHGSWVSFGKEK